MSKKSIPCRHRPVFGRPVEDSTKLKDVLSGLVSGVSEPLWQPKKGPKKTRQRKRKPYYYIICSLKFPQAQRITKRAGHLTNDPPFSGYWFSIKPGQHPGCQPASCHINSPHLSTWESSPSRIRWQYRWPGDSSTPKFPVPDVRESWSSMSG